MTTTPQTRTGTTHAHTAGSRGPLVIRTEGLTKKYGSVTAVDAVDLDVRAGDIYGFLGANGSGKTTTVRCLLGLVLATSGRIEVLGSPMPKATADVLPRIGALVEGPAAYGHLSGRKNLVIHQDDSTVLLARLTEVLEEAGEDRRAINMTVEIRGADDGDGDRAAGSRGSRGGGAGQGQEKREGQLAHLGSGSTGRRPAPRRGRDSNGRNRRAQKTEGPAVACRAFGLVALPE